MCEIKNKQIQKDIENNIDEIIKYKEYLINFNKQLSEEDKKKYLNKDKVYCWNRVSKADYIFFGVRKNINILRSHSSEDVYYVFKESPAYKLYDLKFILEGLIILREPYKKIIDKLPKFLLSILGFQTVGIFIKEEWIKWVKNLIENNIEWIIFGGIVLLVISLWGKEVVVKRAMLDIKYFIFLTDKIIKEKENDKNKNDTDTKLIEITKTNANSIESEKIEVIKINENKVKKKIKKKKIKKRIENKKHQLKTTSTEND